MSAQPTPLTLGELLSHARAAASDDERRHAETTLSGSASQRNEKTIRGWGSAALLDLEWHSRCVYGKVERSEYRAAYAAEYLRLRAGRSCSTPDPEGSSAAGATDAGR